MIKLIANQKTRTQFDNQITFFMTAAGGSAMGFFTPF